MNRSDVFTLFPAIDLRHGRVVRLSQGRDDAKKEYSDDAVAMAASFVEAGANALHVVDLDAAFRDGDNRGLIAEIVAEVPIPVQLGGGIRDDAGVDALLESGVWRVVIGSAAVDNVPWVRDVVARCGAERIVIGIDARDGEVKTHGWTAGAGRSAAEVARDMADAGVETLVFTDIGRDGMLQGPNLPATVELAESCSLSVVVSGGVKTEAHVAECAQAKPSRGSISGVITGRAIYEGTMSLEAALKAAQC